MRICAIADQHGHLPLIEPCDLLLIAGDVCPLEDHDLVFQWEWLDQVYREWLDALPAKQIVGIAGNHDFIFEQDEQIGPDLPWTYLLDSETAVEGFRVYGAPWVPNLPSWAFHDDTGLWVDDIPDDIDILMTHGPPHGVGDKVPFAGHVGQSHLTNALSYRIKPKLHVFGHIHEGRGLYNDRGAKRAGYTTIKLGEPLTMANVTLKDRDYNPKYVPMYFDLPARNGHEILPTIRDEAATDPPA